MPHYHEPDKIMHLLVKSPASGYPPSSCSDFVPDSLGLGALNRSSSQLLALATGTAWSDGRARTTSREQDCRGQPAVEAGAAIESMKISTAAKRFSTWRDARETRPRFYK